LIHKHTQTKGNRTMFRKSTLILIALIAAATAQSSPESEAAGKTIIATANGMVCSFCAQGIQKQFEDEPAVRQVRVNLSRRWIVLAEVDDASISDKRVREHITNAGFETVDIRRTTDSFEAVVDSLRN
jgi:copper chaperone CopZ